MIGKLIIIIIIAIAIFFVINNFQNSMDNFCEGKEDGMYRFYGKINCTNETAVLPNMTITHLERGR